MKLALLSDIHANALAFDACLAHAEVQGAQQVAVLGDSVGYGAEPAAIVQRLMALVAQGGTVLRGNHDAAAALPLEKAGTDSTAPTAESLSAGWTHQQLDPSERAFLGALPLTACEIPCLLVHASADAPERWHYVTDERSAAASLDAACTNAAVRYVFGGHVHHQRLFYRGAGHGLMRFDPRPGVPIPVPEHRRWLATVGSVGQPRDGDPRAMYALFDTDALQLCFHRVPYDHLAAAAAVRAAGLPEFFASRLERGT